MYLWTATILLVAILFLILMLIVIKETHLRARRNFKKIMVINKYGTNRSGSEEELVADDLFERGELVKFDVADYAFVALLKEYDE